jgi:hypothetical protein
VDDQHYKDLEGPYQAELLGEFERRAGETGFAFPPHVNAAIAARQVARGLYERLRQRLPSHLWAGRDESGQPLGGKGAIVAALTAAAERAVTQEMVAEAFGTVHRRLCPAAGEPDA